MKNIHILPTDKPSNLFKDIKNKLMFNKDWIEIPIGRANQHIYITSDEEIKEGDWVIANGGIRFVASINNYKSKTFTDDGTISKQAPSSYCHLKNYKKIILTTDQDLIKDGVQAIDDEFLEWFVKNPSCESVEVDSIETNPDYKSNWENRFTYEIIIPKEEAKPHSFCETPEEKCIMNYCDENGCQNRKRELVEPKQETLDEAAENYSLELLEAKTIQPHEKTWIKSMFVHIARLQQERMYSEEEVYHILCEHTAFLFAGGKSTLTDWFEQFKKK